MRVVADGTAHAYAFELPDRIEAGPTRFSLVNEGEEDHHAQLFRLDPGSTVEELEAALATGGPAAALDHGSLAGGTGLVAPGRTSEADAVVPLAAGQYVLLCFVPGPDGAPHLAHGMVEPFRVEDAGLDSPEAPDPDAGVRLTDYAVDIPATVARGSVLEVANEAAREQHEMIVAGLDGSAGVDDVRAALSSGTPPPITPVGGVQALAPGDTQLLRLDAPPGDYVVLCAIPAADGTPHHLKGMLAPVTVT